MKYIRLLLPLCLCLLLTTTAQGQRHRGSRYSRQVIRAFPVLGATASQMRGDELRGFKKWGFTAGVGAEVSLGREELWALTVEADFSQRGAANRTYDPYVLLDMTLNYVDIPLMVHFTDPYGGITIGAGLSYSRLVQQPHGTILYRPNVFIPDTSDLTFLRNDLCFALDARFPLWKSLYLDVRWQHSLFPVKHAWKFTEYHSETEGGIEQKEHEVYNSSLSLRLLYKFGDDKRTSHKKAPLKKNSKNRRR